MELRQRIESALKDAMRDKDENRRNALRLLLTALKVKEKELRRLPDEAEIQQTISSQIKQRKDAIELYGKGGRADLAATEEAEVRVLQSFLPEALSPEELDRLVDEAVTESGATSAREMGKVMKLLMPKVAGRADGKALNERVRARLGI
jgi:uncharacterized protein